MIISWLFDKLGYMPKVSIDTSWPFPATQRDYVAPECEKPIKKKPAAKKAVRKSVRKKA